MIHAAYMAGFLDADGCFSISFGRNGAYFGIHVIVVQKNDIVVREIHDMYGGTINVTKRGDRRYFRWSVSGKVARIVIEDCLPYLIDKVDQAKLCLEALKHREDSWSTRYRGGCKGTQPLSKEAVAYRRALWLRNKELNTCHKIRAAAETKSSDPETGCDSPSLRVIVGEGAKPFAAEACG